MINRSRSSLSVLLGQVMTALLFAALQAAAQQPQPTPATPSQDQSQAGDKNTPDPKAAAAQQPQSTPATPSQDQSQAGDKNNADTKAKENPHPGTSNDRLFYTLPNFLTMETAGQLPPLTSLQKFQVVARGSFDLVEYPWYGALAGISQAENSEAGYGQGAAGYGKRYAAAFGDGTIENFMVQAVLPSLLKEDPRFYQSGTGTIWHRTGYALSRIFVTRTDSRHEQFNYSEIIGSAIAGVICTYSYHPPADRNIANAAKVWGTQVGYDMITIVVKEFWPDVRRKISQKRQHEPDAH